MTTELGRDKCGIFSEIFYSLKVMNERLVLEKAVLCVLQENGADVNDASIRKLISESSGEQLGRNLIQIEETIKKTLSFSHASCHITNKIIELLPEINDEKLQILMARDRFGRVKSKIDLGLM